MVGRMDSYVIVARALVDGRLSAQEFETVFLSIFNGEGDVFPDVETRALHRLFSDVDAYCADPDLRNSSDIDGVELIASACRFLEVVQ
jgi:hypothetical protein